MTNTYASAAGRVTLLAGILAIALAAPQRAPAQQAAQSDDWERCYGIALAGENDGLASGAAEFIPGSSQSDFQGDAWVLVPRGECETTETPAGSGSLAPR